MKVRSFFILMLGVAVCSFGAQCASSQKKERSAKDQYQLASKYLAKEEFIKAIEAFQALVYNFPGSEWVDDGQYGLAESYFRSKDYVNAVFEYERIVNDFSMSPLVEKAQFKIAMCYFKQSLDAVRDQENTYQAIQNLPFALLQTDNPSRIVHEFEGKLRLGRTRYDPLSEKPPAVLTEIIHLKRDNLKKQLRSGRHRIG